VALTTPISSNFFPAPWCRGKSIGTWYGHTIPVGVMEVYECQDLKTSRVSVNWQTKDGTIHTMPCDPSAYDQFEAVIVAMKLSC
jgi:hypothetical protein